MKTYKINGYTVAPIMWEYANNKSLAITLEIVEEDYVEETFALITTNLCSDVNNSIREMFGKDAAFVDTNNVPDVINFIKENKLAKDTHQFGYSGFCFYPLFVFDRSKLNTPEELEAFNKEHNVVEA